jgi:hypothetical protein
MIGIGLGLGVAASRLLKASSQTRYRATQTPPSRPPAALAPPPAVEEPVTRVGYVAQPGVYP